VTGERCCGCVVTGVVYDNAATDAYLAFRIEVDRYNNRSVNLKLNREERVVDTTNSYQLTRAGMSPIILFFVTCHTPIPLHCLIIYTEISASKQCIFQMF
jgi:hypothetical protein